MSQAVVIKSNKYGINLILDKDMAFQELLTAIKEKFQESEKFFKNAKMAISFEGRTLTQEEEYQIIEHVKDHFNHIQEEIETLVATSEENSATIQNITETIAAQNDSINNISTEIEEISSLSLDLEQHFTK